MNENEFSSFLSEMFADFGTIFNHTDGRLEAVKAYDKAQYAQHNSVDYIIEGDAESDWDAAEYHIWDEYWDAMDDWTTAEEDEDIITDAQWMEQDDTYASSERWNIKRDLGE